MPLTLLSRALVVAILGSSHADGPRQWDMEITPAHIAIVGGTLRLALPEDTTRFPGTPPQGALWVGLSFGEMARLEVTTAPFRRGSTLCIEVPPLRQLFSQSPRPGDQLLLVVYASNRPLAGPQALPVVADAGVPISTPCVSFRRLP